MRSLEFRRGAIQQTLWVCLAGSGAVPACGGLARRPAASATIGCGDGVCVGLFINGPGIVVAEPAVAVGNERVGFHDHLGRLLHKRCVGATGGVHIGDGGIGAHALFIGRQGTNAGDELHFFLRIFAGRCGGKGCLGAGLAGGGERCVLRGALGRLGPVLSVGRGVCVGAVLGNLCRAFLALDQSAGLPLSARRIGVDALACCVGAAMHLGLGLGCRDHDSANGDSHQSACSHGFLLYREQRLSHRVR